jgi:hypothetical protein
MPATYYNPRITAKKSVLTGLWMTILPAVMVWLSTSDFPATVEEWKAQWPFLAVGLGGALIRWAQNWWKHAHHGFPHFIIPFALAGLTLSGCATGLIRPGIGDHSRTIVEFDETTAAGDKTRIKFQAHGEAASSAAVHYNGEGPDPWRLSVTGDSTVTSPQAQAIADGMGVLLAETPQTVQALVAQLSTLGNIMDATGGGGGMQSRIVELLIQRFLSGIIAP